MPRDTDYDEIVEGTIDEVQEAVEEQDLDLEALLAAEKANKDRVTLTNWLEDRIDESSAAEDDADEVTEQATREEPDEGEEPEAVEPYTPSDSSVFAPLRTNWKAAFATGAILGALAVAVVFSTSLAPLTSGNTGSPGEQVSASAASSELQTYLQDNRQALRLPQDSQVTVTNVEEHTGTAMYRATLEITATVQNRTVTQDVNAFMTRDAQYVFFNQPIDMTQPVQDQLQQTQPSAQPPQ